MLFSAILHTDPDLKSLACHVLDFIKRFYTLGSFFFLRLVLIYYSVCDVCFNVLVKALCESASNSYRHILSFGLFYSVIN